MVAARTRLRGFVPVSFRARIMLSSTILTALLLTVALCGIAALVLERTSRATMSDVDRTEATTRAIVTANWQQGDDAIIRLVEAQTQPAGVRLTIHYRPARPDERGSPPLEAPAGFVPGAPPPDGRPAPPPEAAGGPPPGFNGNGPPLRAMGIESLIGVQHRFVPLREAIIDIAPDDSLRAAVMLYAIVFGSAELVSLLASWAIGRTIANQAVSPLRTVTAELQRFAAGDFVPSTLETLDRNELGELIVAYNGAAAQVAAAFSERERTERHLRLFLGEAGHEMRTPITVISAYLDLLEATVSPEAILSPATLASARVQMRRLRNLVERVMALARMEGTDAAAAELIDVVEIAQEAIASVTVARGGTVRFTHDAEDVVIRGEAWALQEAIGNLIDNAIVYGGGAPVDVSIAIAGAAIVIRVRDGGPGISPADRARLFQHFFRGDASDGKRGSGLGLAIVARAAVRLGGEIVLEDAGHPGGATFRLSIPIYQPDTKSISQPPRSKL
jgi:signal transduction histidine kinase